MFYENIIDFFINCYKKIKEKFIEIIELVFGHKNDLNKNQNDNKVFESNEQKETNEKVSDDSDFVIV